jgi:hypothetical protein
MSSCTLQVPTAPKVERHVVVEFLYIDLTSCSRCLGTDAQLEAALALIKPVLEATGVAVELRKILVESAQQAHTLRFTSSPTIRIDGRDIALELVESICGSCSGIAGQDTGCREWVYHGERHTEAPLGLIMEAILGALYGRELVPPTPYADVPDNLKRFFAATHQAAAAEERSCCSAVEQASCCAPLEKAACCGTTASQRCGCKAGRSDERATLHR